MVGILTSRIDHKFGSWLGQKMREAWPGARGCNMAKLSAFFPFFNASSKGLGGQKLVKWWRFGLQLEKTWAYCYIYSHTTRKEEEHEKNSFWCKFSFWANPLALILLKNEKDARRPCFKWFESLDWKSCCEWCRNIFKGCHPTNIARDRPWLVDIVGWGIYTNARGVSQKSQMLYRIVTYQLLLFRNDIGDGFSMKMSTAICF